MLPNQIHDAPTAIPLLDIAHRERRHFGAPQSAAQEHRQDRPVTEPLGRGDVGRVQEPLSLLDRKPIPQSDTLRCHTLHARDSTGDFGRQ